MIEIICDLYELCLVNEGDILVTEVDQFEDNLAQIKSHSTTGESLRVIVRNLVLFRHFDAAIKYGVTKKILDPVKMLSEALQQSVSPRYLHEKPEWVVDLDLLSKAKKFPSSGEAIENWLKRVLLGDAWGDKFSASQENLSAIFAYFTGREEENLHPLEKYLVNKQLQKWLQENTGKTELLTWLQEAPFQRTKFAIWEQKLSLFPGSKISDWLQQDDIWFELSKFPNRTQLPLLVSSLQIPEKIAAFARDFLLGKWKVSPEEAMPFISGKLDFEINFLKEQLRQQLQVGETISSSVYDRIVALNIHEVTSLAKQLILADPPSLIPKESSVSVVQEWLEDEYLPFYNSCSLLGKLAETKPYLESFEDWLLLHYKKEMLFNGEGMAYRQISQLKGCSVDEPILMVVFDGLDYLCASEELLPIMQNNGFFPLNEPTPFFSFLPSQTDIAKPVLVAGKMKSQIPDEKPNAVFYKELLQGCLGLSGNDIRSKTDKDGTLLELIQEPAKIYLYLDNQLDREYLHSNLHQYSRKRKYGDYICQQTKKIVQCLNDFKDLYGKSLKVVICSDHGYTILPKDADVIKVTASKISKTRTLSGYEPKHIEGLSEQNMWKLHPDLYGLHEEMIVPRGYSCFNSRPYGATHGGCSPQEMAVPWFLLSDEKPTAFEPLSFSFGGEIFRKRSENQIVLNISNPNRYAVTIVEMEVSGIETSSSLPIKIGKNDTQRLHSSFNASSIGENNIEFSIRYRIKSMAGEAGKSLIIKVPTKGAMSTDFDDDFDI
jgi:hypothetical protein